MVDDHYRAFIYSIALPFRTGLYPLLFQKLLDNVQGQHNSPRKPLAPPDPR